MDATLPGLGGLAKLADCRPVIVIDTREQTPLVFTRLPSVTKALQSGDYSSLGLEGRFAVERKSLDDLANCCVGANRDRFEREYLLHMLQMTEGNVSQAARLAERNRSDFYKLLRKHELDPMLFRDEGQEPADDAERLSADQ